MELTKLKFKYFLMAAAPRPPSLVRSPCLDAGRTSQPHRLLVIAPHRIMRLRGKEEEAGARRRRGEASERRRKTGRRRSAEVFYGGEAQQRRPMHTRRHNEITGRRRAFIPASPPPPPSPSFPRRPLSSFRVSSSYLCFPYLPPLLPLSASTSSPLYLLISSPLPPLLLPSSSSSSPTASSSSPSAFASASSFPLCLLLATWPLPLASGQLLSLGVVGFDFDL